MPITQSDGTVTKKKRGENCGDISPPLLVVIPAYNEEERILSVIAGVRKEIEGKIPFEILVVNDGSTDKTEEILLQDSEINLISHQQNAGYGTTLQCAYKFANRNGFQLLIQLDGDGQHHPFYLKKMYQELTEKKADVIIGSRFLECDDKPEIEGEAYTGTFFRLIGMKLFSHIASFFCSQTITDPTSGYIGMNRETFSFLCGDIYPNDYPDADVVIMLCKRGLRVKEIPVLMLRNESKGSLHRGLKPVYYIYKMFFSILVTLLRKH